MNLSSLDVMQKRLKKVNKYLEGQVLKDTVDLTDELNDLEELEEIQPLTNEQWLGVVIFKALYESLEEEQYWHRRLSEDGMLKGDNNTSCFHRIAKEGKIVFSP